MHSAADQTVWLQQELVQSSFLASCKFIIVNCVISGDIYPSLLQWAATSRKWVGEELEQELLQ